MTTTIPVYAISFLLVLLVALSGMRFRPDTWYAALRKPPGLPPNWIFPVVWSLLYLVMAWAAARIWPLPVTATWLLAVGLYGAQLLVNAAWSWLFFSRHRPGLALWDLTALLLLVCLTTWQFALLDPWAAALMIPYIVWLGLAWYLNAAVWWLNRQTTI